VPGRYGPSGGRKGSAEMSTAERITRAATAGTVGGALVIDGTRAMVEARRGIERHVADLAQLVGRCPVCDGGKGVEAAVTTVEGNTRALFLACSYCMGSGERPHDAYAVLALYAIELLENVLGERGGFMDGATAAEVGSHTLTIVERGEGA